MTPLPLFRAFWPQRVGQKVKIPGRTAPPGHNGDDDYGDDDDDNDDSDDDDDYLGPAFDILQFTKSTNISQSQIIIFCMEGMEACFSLGQPSPL